ncbi:hypothetical protein JW826_00935 [Candidatus Woesearchaeota archaeon]|nr:hypothetical protein [Candidatus Woesearchaeota archaeon]
MSRLPKGLRGWFIAHFVIDTVFAIPLLFFPRIFLSALGFTTIDPLAARLVGAALVGIGGASFIMRDKGRDAYESMLSLKLLWSSTAILAAAITLVERSAPLAASVGILLVFAAFFLVWAHYRQRIRQG